MTDEPAPSVDPPGGHAAQRLREQLERDLGEVPAGLLPDVSSPASPHTDVAQDGAGAAPADTDDDPSAVASEE